MAAKRKPAGTPVTFSVETTHPHFLDIVRLLGADLPEPAADEPEPEPEPEPKPEPKPKQTRKTAAKKDEPTKAAITLDKLMDAVKALVDSSPEGTDNARETFKQFKIKRVRDLKESDYSSFYATILNYLNNLDASDDASDGDEEFDF